MRYEIPPSNPEIPKIERAAGDRSTFQVIAELKEAYGAHTEDTLALRNGAEVTAVVISSDHTRNHAWMVLELQPGAPDDHRIVRICDEPNDEYEQRRREAYARGLGVQGLAQVAAISPDSTVVVFDQPLGERTDRLETEDYEAMDAETFRKSLQTIEEAGSLQLGLVFNGQKMFYDRTTNETIFLDYLPAFSMQDGVCYEYLDYIDALSGYDQDSQYSPYAEEVFRKAATVFVQNRPEDERGLNMLRVVARRRGINWEYSD